jgi:hypothetical protein
VPIPPNLPTSSRSPSGPCPARLERYAKRLASPMAELQAFYDAAFPRLEDAMTTSTSSSWRGSREDRSRLLWLLLGLLVNGFVPGRGVASAPVPDSGAASMDVRRRAGSVTGPR